jgi:type 1 glutamine amidotransferase
VASPRNTAPATSPVFRLLVFSRTTAFRHASIPAAITALGQLAAEHQVSVDFTEDPTCFTDATLAQYQAVVFLLTTGNVLDGDQQAAFERYIRKGGGYVGVHSASDTEYGWAWYGGLVGAYFDRVHGHSTVVQATLHVVNRTHPSTSPLPATWVRSDEWYNFATNPRGQVTVLLTIDEHTYQGGVMGDDHPLAWYHPYDGGRAWYTALGHTIESYSEPLFLAHLWGGITYAAGIGGKERSKKTSTIQARLWRPTQRPLDPPWPAALHDDRLQPLPTANRRQAGTGSSGCCCCGEPGPASITSEIDA